MNIFQGILASGFIALTLYPYHGKAQVAPLVTRISPVFFGQNAWMPDKIGTEFLNGDLEELLCGPLYTSPPDLCVPAEIKASGVKLMRYGGNTVDQFWDPALSPPQYLTMVDNMAANDIQPLLQVPYFDGAFHADQAGKLVEYINVTNNRAVKYWTIGNEPNEKYTKNADAPSIAKYFKRFAKEMRTKDEGIVIVGPDLSFYDSTIMEILTDPQSADSICGLYLDKATNKEHSYLDIINFHTYPFPSDETDPPVAPSRADVIAFPQTRFQDKVLALKARVEGCNRPKNRHKKKALKMAVTEINVEYRHPLLSVDKSLTGVGAMSFLAGHFWADVMNVGIKHGLEFVTFWSVKEGDDLGYISNDDGTKLPTYYHYQMMAKNFRGVYAGGTDSVNGVDDPNVSAFGAKDSDQIVVMLLNSNEETPVLAPLAYTVRLDTAPSTSPSPLLVNIDAGVNQEYHGVIGQESTVLLVFDPSGLIRHRYVYDRSTNAYDGDPPTRHPN